jgi:hypothetical protein
VLARGTTMSAEWHWNEEPGQLKVRSADLNALRLVDQNWQRIVRSLDIRSFLCAGETLFSKTPPC